MVSETIFVVFTGVMLGALLAMLLANETLHKTFFGIISIMVSLIGAKWCSSGSVVEILHGLNQTSNTIVVHTESIQTSELTYFYMFVLGFSVIYILIEVVQMAIKAFGDIDA